MAADLFNVVSPVAKATVAAPAYTEGQPSGLSLDLLGNLRVTGSFTVTGGSTSNATSGVATSATNEAVVSYNYGFNGTTWDQLQVDANKFLKVAPSASAAAGGIPSISRLLSAAGTSGDATNVKASAGRVYFIRGTNVRTSAVYLKLYNSATAPTAGSGTPIDTIYLPPSGSFVLDFPVGLTFSTGIGFTLVTGGADNSSTSVTAGDILALSIGYA